MFSGRGGGGSSGSGGGYNAYGITSGVGAGASAGNGGVPQTFVWERRLRYSDFHRLWSDVLEKRYSNLPGFPGKGGVVATVGHYVGGGFGATGGAAAGAGQVCMLVFLFYCVITVLSLVLCTILYSFLTV